MQIPKPETKAIFQLRKMVGFDCVVRLRSSPETIITGILDSFDMNVVPSLINIDCGSRGLRIINFQDVSFIEEIRDMR